jgi:hypothetical protein
LQYRIARVREAIRARIARALPDAPYAGVLEALAIGDQRAIPHGTAHLKSNLALSSEPAVLLDLPIWR